ncbi:MULTISPECIES: lysozyme [Enterobacter]|jgi:lysozyme|uniref:Lysozyme n=1 Tax=Enterobacter cancerogenus TaxID=69218 RepID=A0AB38P028_9ENTR|nr:MULTISPECIES: lysozyme [Enterobacter]EKS7428630.1 lysozyme [Enterobacter cancerogenus]KTQ47655.1 lysozyme [Enterobacter cancerogenus]KTQ53611.1 lysozyme [Enterobacter cancerogenus]KTQ70282.1 lysozyme [Enterobacter cancerogenus]KTQ78662.1 lysozyme [Enterobacter cancerogenus]
MNGYSLQISLAAVELIKKQQGLSLEKYRDAQGVWVIGYGHVIRAWERFDIIITPDDADMLLENDLRICEALLRENITRPLTQRQHDTLVAWIFSLGDTPLSETALHQAVMRV